MHNLDISILASLRHIIQTEVACVCTRAALDTPVCATCVRYRKLEPQELPPAITSSRGPVDTSCSLTEADLLQKLFSYSLDVPAVSGGVAAMVQAAGRATRVLS